MNITVSDIIEIIKAIGFLCIPLATAYTIVISSRLKSVSDDVLRLEKNTNSISERNQAIANKLGITEGIAQERAAAQAAGITTPPLPLPVSDEKNAEKLDKVVEAIQDSALSKKV